jgi:hypothetical protein
LKWNFFPEAKVIPEKDSSNESQVWVETVPVKGAGTGDKAAAPQAPPQIKTTNQIAHAAAGAATDPAQPQINLLLNNVFLTAKNGNS